MNASTKKQLKITGAILGALLLFGFKRSSALANLVTNASINAFGTLNAEQKNAIQQITNAFKTYGDGDNSKLAYIIATAWHESRLRPIKEIRAQQGTPLYAQQNNYWHTGYYGRGYVQLTWLNNYQKMSNWLNLDLVNNPELVMQPEVAAKIMVYGMMNGSFTSRPLSLGGAPYKLSDFINGNTNNSDYYNARRVVNGLDRAQLINDYTIQLTNYTA